MEPRIFTDRPKNSKPSPNPHHSKNSLSESSLKNSCSSLVQEQIREYLKKDKEARLPKLKLKHSRDVSYIRDLKFSKSSFNPIPLPRSLEELRTHDTIQSFSQLNVLHRKSCSNSDLLSSRSECVKDPVKYLENLTSKPPSGRKEAENLLEWFNYMKKLYEKEADFEVVIWKCAEELCRQITVECRERGELFKAIFGYFQGIFDAKAEDIRSFCENYENICKRKIIRLQVHHLEEVGKIKQKMKEIVEERKGKEEEIEKVERELMIYKKKFYEMHKMVNGGKVGERKEFGEDMEKIVLREQIRTGRAHKTQLDPQTFFESKSTSNHGSNSPFDLRKSPVSIQILEFYKENSTQTSLVHLDKSSQFYHSENNLELSKTHSLLILPVPIMLKRIHLDKPTQTISLQFKGTLEAPHKLHSLRDSYSPRQFPPNSSKNEKRTLNYLFTQRLSISSSSSRSESEELSQNTKINYKKGSIMVIPAKNEGIDSKTHENRRKKIGKAKKTTRKSEFNFVHEENKKKKEFRKGEKFKSFLAPNQYRAPGVTETFLLPNRTMSSGSGKISLLPDNNFEVAQSSEGDESI